VKSYKKNVISIKVLAVYKDSHAGKVISDALVMLIHYVQPLSFQDWVPSQHGFSQTLYRISGSDGTVLLQ